MIYTELLSLEKVKNKAIGVQSKKFEKFVEKFGEKLGDALHFTSFQVILLEPVHDGKKVERAIERFSGPMEPQSEPQ